ncbi:MAG: XRE family transcriptional regulator [Bdellovibrionales bacterium]|nr:helix-turn-helix domain-containing protein [Bdellovibrionales bacterium]NQZ17641.1 XRE family transcriptional regulator [Bdellovibrionales bacterium]
MATSKKKTTKKLTTSNAQELADILGLTPADGIDIEFSVELNDKIVNVVKRQGFTHAEVAKLSGVGRTKVTSIMNRNLHEISIKTLIRVLGGLGYKVSPKISKVA